MHIKTILAAALTGLLLTTASCASSNGAAKGESVAYSVANRYFFNNGATPPASNKVTDAETFSKLFGMATVMGKNGQPTEIDFSKEFVIPVVLPETNRATSIKLGKLVEEGDGLTLYYKVKQGEERSYTIRPMELLIVDGKHAGKRVTLKAQ